MVLDEPTTGMDVEGRRELLDAIRHDAERGRTVLFATHYLEEADAYADRIVLLRAGPGRGRRHAAEVKNLATGRSQGHPAHADASRPGRLPGVDAVEVRGDRSSCTQTIPTPSRDTC